jgi:glycosyltransferase involved in cell wall biosynthesis
MDAEHLPNQAAPPDPSNKDDTRPHALTRMDMHCHSNASDAPAIAALGLIDAPECYSTPEMVYDQARARGMDLVTITDHDTIKGGLKLVERGYQDFVLGQEVSVFFPEDRCLLHILVWGLTPDLDEQLNTLNLREDVYEFAAWLHEHNLAHSFAHPLYIQNGKLTRWHLERAALLFKGWEIINGAHTGAHRVVIERYLSTLTPASVQLLAQKHSIHPRFPRIWHKARTAGSDDHGRMNIGQTFTAVRSEPNTKITDPHEFLRRVMVGRSTVAGQAGHSSLLAHQLSTVAVNFYADQIHENISSRGRYIASKLTRFAGVKVSKPSKARVAASITLRKLISRKKKSLPIIDALKDAIGPVLEQYPDLKAKLDPNCWDAGAPVADHERMAQFTHDLCHAISSSMASGAVSSLRKRDKLGIVDHLISYAIIHAAQLPYIFSMFYQNKERNMLEKLEHEVAQPGSGVSVLERPMRVSLFTDTLGDINGVSRFIQNVAAQATRTGRDLRVVTSTSFECPDRPNVYNFEPVFATRMPKYEQLELVLPPLLKILRHVDEHQPDVIHISTPGPVGLIGFIAAKMLRIPVLGVYHTDFPAYIDHIFDDHAFTATTRAYMRFFYEPFTAIFTRSEQYVDALDNLGMRRERILPLMPGLETEQFNPSFQDLSIWDDLEAEGLTAISRPSVKVLYVGRVSVEKNMPFLTAVWKRVAKKCAHHNIPADLIVVGDGPYRSEMQRLLDGHNAHFLGFRHDHELSTIYASADCFAFPSTTDTLGQVVMESQASGLPVIVTDLGGPKEVVTDGDTGFVLPAENLDAWVDHLFLLISDDDRRRKMSDMAIDAMQGFDISHSFEDFWMVHTQAWHDHLSTLGITPRTPSDSITSPTPGESSPHAPTT